MKRESKNDRRNEIQPQQPPDVCSELGGLLDLGMKREALNLARRIFKSPTLTAKTFNDRDLYPYAYQLTGVNVAHGANAALVGKDLIGLKDQNGKFLIREIIEIAKSGKPGWVDYKWPNPITNKIEDKSAYVDVVDGYAIGVGVYR